jgi:hypothetical protein
VKAEPCSCSVIAATPSSICIGSAASAEPHQPA